MGSGLELRTDHNNLKYFTYAIAPKMNSKEDGWKFLASTIEANHINDKKNKVADALSHKKHVATIS